MWRHQELSDVELYALIRQKQLALGGNSKLKIYGKLSCASGKRMKRANRVFFTHEVEAMNAGYRPCGHCMNAVYKKWKEKNELI